MKSLIGKNPFAIVFALLFFVSALALIIHFGGASKAYASEIDVWWPTDGAEVSGAQPFKAMVPGRDVADYQMFWYVDGGQWNFMGDDWRDYPHKETDVDVSTWAWRAGGPYTVTFVATDFSGRKMAEESVNIFVPVHHTPVAESTAEDGDTSSGLQARRESKGMGARSAKQKDAPHTEDGRMDVPEPQVQEKESQQMTSSAGGNPFSGATLYSDPNSPAMHFADMWRASRPHEAAMLDKIASQPTARWFGGWNADVQGDARQMAQAAAAAGSVPVYIAYNVPARDCGSYSAGGAGSPDGYRAWIESLASGIGSNQAVVILEPDALSSMDCLSPQDQETRLQLLRDAINILNSRPNISVYLDAGHAHWTPAAEMASRLQRAGVSAARGFALNVSNYISSEDNIRYGEQVSGILGGKNFVVDTSRNGLGPAPGNEWCNPSGRALGSPPTTNTGHGLIDAFLWLKVPGESDGTCNGGPNAGEFWPEYAVGLAERALW